MTSPVRRAALSAIRDGRVTIFGAEDLGMAGGPNRIRATVRSSRPERTQPYVIDLLGGGWHCTCRAGGDGCAHIASVQLVTGHPSAADKEPKT